MNDVTSFVVSLLSSLTVSSALSAVMIWLGKSTISERIKNSIKAEYDYKLEVHKDQLKASSDREIEKLKADLHLAATEHQVRFSDLHIKRAEIIAKAYEKFVLVLNHGTGFANPIQSVNADREAQFRTVKTYIYEFYQYFDRNRIYLPASLCDRISPLVSDIQAKIYMLGYAGFPNLSTLGSEERAAIMDRGGETWKYFNEEIPKARELLEAEFRSLLGDKS